MPKIIITIEDKPGNRVEVAALPSAMELFKKSASGHTLSSAEAYALYALRQLREESMRQGATTKILIPKVGRA